MEDAWTVLLWSGIAGWFTLTFLHASGNGKGWLRNLLVTVFYWMICVDIFGVLLGTAFPILHKAGSGRKFVVFFVVLPYVMGGLRLSWLLRAKRKRGLKADA